MLSLRHLALRVKDIHRSLDFYTGILKMKVEWHPDAKNVYLTTGTDNLALHQLDSLVSADESVPTLGMDHFGFLVSKPEEVDEWACLLEAHGIKLVQQPRTHRDGARSIYFCDPDGNLIQLLYHPPLS